MTSSRDLRIRETTPGQGRSQVHHSRVPTLSQDGTLFRIHQLQKQARPAGWRRFFSRLWER